MDQAKADQLIAEVKGKPLIWLPTHEDYRTPIKREQAWYKIAENCHPDFNSKDSDAKKQDVETLKMKWTSFKRGFNREKRKIKNARSGNGADIGSKTYRLFNQLQFLNDVAESQHESVDAANEIMYEINPDNPTETASDKDIQMPPPLSKKRKSTIAEEQYILQTIAKHMAKREANSSSDKIEKNDHDPDKCFIITLLPGLRGLSEDTKGECQIQIMKILHDFVIKDKKAALALQQNQFVQTQHLPNKPMQPHQIPAVSNLGSQQMKRLECLYIVPDLVERMGGVAAPSTSSMSGSGGPLGGVRCKSEEALSAVGYGGDDDVDQCLEEDVTVEPEFLHDPLDVKVHVQGTGQAINSPSSALLSPPSTVPLRLSQHHQPPPSTTGTAGNNCTEENNVQQESASARSTTSPPQPPALTGPYLLKKETHCSTVLDQLLRDETFTDVTLTAEGQSIRAHRVVLCLASAYFRQVLSHDQNVHSVVILRDIKFAELKSIIHFIYTGEATVDATELESFMKTAEILEISSLCEGHKSISTGGLVSQSYGSGFNIGEFERLMGTKRNRKDASPMPFKNRKISGEQSSRSSTPGISATSVTCVKEEPIDPDNNRMNIDDPVYRGNGRHSKGVLEESPEFASKTLSTAFDTGEMAAMDEGSNSGGDGKSDTSGRSSPSIMMPDITTLPGRCPYCPHLNQEFRGVSMMRHLLVSHPCKPAFPCDNCFRVFVRKNKFRAHQAKCNDV